MNYFNYFTEIEQRFQQRRGSLLMLSTLDWALIETWREAEVPLAAVLRGIDAAFDKHDLQAQRSTRRPRKVNGLAWCAQAVLEAVVQSREAAIGVADSATQSPRDSGFESARIARYLLQNAAVLNAANLPQSARAAAAETAARLRELAQEINSDNSRTEGAPRSALERAPTMGPPVSSSGSSSLRPRTSNLEELDRTLTVLEERLFAAILTSSSEDELVALREQAVRELAPYRGKMQAVQIKQVQQQFLQKRLLEAHALPRLSLFYMPHEDEA